MFVADLHLVLPYMFHPLKYVWLESSFWWDWNNEWLWSKTILQTLRNPSPHISRISEGSANQSQPAVHYRTNPHLPRFAWNLCWWMTSSLIIAHSKDMNRYDMKWQELMSAKRSHNQRPDHARPTKPKLNNVLNSFYPRNILLTCFQITFSFLIF